MHRGSSKEAAGRTPTSEDLPLSASPAPRLHVTVDLVRARNVDRREVELAAGSTVRDAVHRVGMFAEATSALIDGKSVPFDRPLSDGDRIELLRTFSGG